MKILRVNAILPSFFIGDQNRRLLTQEDGSLTERGRLVVAIRPSVASAVRMSCMGRSTIFWQMPRDLLKTVPEVAETEMAPIFQRASGRAVTKSLGGFVRVTHPERMHDRLSAGGYPVWLEARARY